MSILDLKYDIKNWRHGRGNRRSISATCKFCSMRRIMSGIGFLDFFVIFRKTISPDGRTHNSVCWTRLRLLKISLSRSLLFKALLSVYVHVYLYPIIWFGFENSKTRTKYPDHSLKLYSAQSWRGSQSETLLMNNYVLPHRRSFQRVKWCGANERITISEPKSLACI